MTSHPMKSSIGQRQAPGRAQALGRAQVLGRRQLLGLAAAGAVLGIAGLGIAGCSGCPAPTSSTLRRQPASGVPPGSGAAPVTDVPLAVGGPYTLQDLLSTPSFYIAHRGSGDNWPEHTMRAYRNSTDMGLKAIEVSVSATADGVLVCHHDLNTLRMTGTDLVISRASYAALESLRNDARAWLGPATELEPIPMLHDVLDAFAASHVIFLEDKQGTNAEAILQLLEGYPDARKHIVWKQPATSSGHAIARDNGYTTWGYFASGELERTEAIDDVDLLGIPSFAPGEKVREFVDAGKPVIGWEVHRRSERDRLLALGVRGIMCSNVRYVLQRDDRAPEDSFDTGSRSAGDLPWDASDWLEQPAFVDGAVRMESRTTTAYAMGSMGPVDFPGWNLEFEMRWPEQLPRGGPGGGVAFCLADDAAWRPGQRPSRGSYQLDVAAAGTITLYRDDPDEGQPVRLAEMRGDRVVAGTWQRIVVAVMPAEISATRMGGSSGWTARAADTRYGGGYFSVTKNYDGGPPVEFRNLKVSSVPVAGNC